MSIKRGLIGAAAGAVVALGVLTAPAQATSESGVGAAALSCSEPWADQNTIGYYCTGNGNVQFRAKALCGNGQAVSGTWRYATGVWSYAYCAGKGGLVDGFLQTRPA